MTNVELIRTKITEELPKWDQPSLAVAIIKDGEVEMCEGFGLANVETGLKPDANTIYQIGSCTKAFTAAAVAILVDQGKVKWDNPIKQYLPWIAFKDQYTTENATVRDLLCHRTGLPRHDAYWIYGPHTRRQCVENLANMQPVWPLRTQWCYQNTCYIALGMMIEAVSGMTWEKFIQESILDPLGMDHTVFYLDAMRAVENHAEPYARMLPTDTKGYEHIPFFFSDAENMAEGIGAPFGPAGSMMSNLNDMIKWVKLFQNNGKVGDKQLISEESMTELTKPQMAMSQPLIYPFPEQDFFSYGMGWFIESYRGHKMVEHGGNIDGFSTLVTMIPDQKLAVIAMTNFDNGFTTYASTYHAIDTYLGAEDGDWHNRWRELIDMMLASLPAQIAEQNGDPVPNTTPTHPMEDYVGVYVNPTYGKVTISLNDEGLTYLYNKVDSPLKHFHYDSFLITNPKHLYFNNLVNFVVDPHGKISSLVYDAVINPEAKPEIFTKVEEEA